MVDFDTLEAGRETDVLVAEKVMGLTVARWGDVDVVAKSPELMAAKYATPLNSYSTDIKAAWEVLERMDVYHVEKSDLGVPPYRVFVAVHQGEHSSKMRTAEVEGEDLPLAICRAALKAVPNTNQPSAGRGDSSDSEVGSSSSSL